MLAKDTRGYDLLRALLGRDPITGEPHPPTAENLIGGFMKLIGQEEVWLNIKRGNAVARAWAWFQGAVAGLKQFALAIPGQVVATLRSLTFPDVVTVFGAFDKIGSSFAGIAGRFTSWAGQQVLRLLEILVSVVAPGVMPYIAKAKTAFQTIVEDPVRFVGHLVRAGRLGFEKFADNILEHLKSALIKWLAGPLAQAGVHIPKSFSLLEIVKLVLSVLGLTWQNIRTKLVKIIPEPVLQGLEKTAAVLVTLVTDGPAAAWEQIKTELNELKDQLIGQVTSMIQLEVVKAAVKKLVMMINPAGAVVQAIQAVWTTVTFFIEKAQQIGAVVASFIDSIAAIAAGQVENAAKRVEKTMADTLVVVIGFLANFAGLGGIPTKLVGIVKKIRAPIDRGLDKIVAWLGKMLQSLVGKAKDAAKKLLQWWKKKIPIKAGNESHTLTFQGEGRTATLAVMSTPEKPSKFAKQRMAKNGAVANKPKEQEILANVTAMEADIATRQKALELLDSKSESSGKVRDEEVAKQNDQLDSSMRKLAAALGEVPSSQEGERQEFDIQKLHVGTLMNLDGVAYRLVTRPTKEHIRFQNVVNAELKTYKSGTFAKLFHIGRYFVIKNPEEAYNTMKAAGDGMLAPGKYAKRSIPGTASREWSKEVRLEINAIMEESGCHACGPQKPGSKATPDHQPPLALSKGPYRLYPHCKNCSDKQGGMISAITQRLRKTGK